MKTEQKAVMGGVSNSRDAGLISSLRESTPEIMRQFRVPGLNIAVARRGQVIWEEGFGYADLARKTPMMPDTVMHSGSMGKLYTATAVMQLVESGVIGLHDPINRNLKGFQAINPLGEREITFYDLLTHRSGLTGNAAGPDFAPPAPLAEHVKEGYSRTTFEPYRGAAVPRWSAKVGTTYQYSNFGMATLGYLVQITNPEGLSFSEYVQKYIMDPLGMTSSQYPPVQDAVHIRPEIFTRLSAGYAAFGPLWVPTPAIYFADHPAGTVVTTPGDHLRVLLAMMNGGSLGGYQLLKPETVRLMLTPQIPVEVRGPTAEVGLVWNVLDSKTEDYSFGHGGAHMYGWANSSRAFPRLDFALVTATNYWNMTSDADAWDKGVSVVIAQCIANCVKRERMGARQQQQPHSWAWKASYVAGLIMAERMIGGLGMKSPLTEEMVDAMAAGAQLAPFASSQVWDADGFRAGVKDMLSVDMTPDAITAFLRSDRLQVRYEQLDVLYRELGARGVPLLPWYASRVP